VDKDEDKDQDKDKDQDQAFVDLHRRVYGGLIDRVRRDKYPSATLMDLIERGAWDDELAEYLAALAEKVEADRFPSLDLVKRMARIAS
jgi:hypothetical protein